MSARSPHITLNNRVQMPAIGLGVFQTPPAETVGAVEAAIATGYRLIDTAAAYANEHEVGEGIRRSGISRDEVFIETKIWISDYGYDSTLHAFDKSARKLGVDRIDLLLLHQPLPSAFDRTLEAYRALEKLLADGKVRAIGVSNFMPAHLERLLGAGGRRARRESDRGPSVLSAGRTSARPHGTWDRDPGLVANRRRRCLPGPREDHPRGPGAARDRAPARQVARPGDASLASAERTWGDPEVDQAGPHRRELRHLRLRAHTGAVAAIDALDTGVRGGPEPDTITLENYGRPIPEAQDGTDGAKEQK